MKPPSYVSILIVISSLLSACGGGEIDTKDAKPTDDDSCSVFKALKNGHKTLFESLPQQDHEWPDPTFQKNADVITLTLDAGYRRSSIPEALKKERPFRYIDFDTNSVLKISDKEGMDSNTKWDIAIRNFNLFTNGGQFKGSRQITKIDESTAKDFNSFTKTDASQINADKFISSGPINEAEQKICKLALVGKYYKIPRSAINILNKNNQNMPYDYNATTHTPQARLGDFYLFRDTKDPDWYVTLKITKITYNDTKNLTSFTFQYKKL